MILHLRPTQNPGIPAVVFFLAVAPMALADIHLRDGEGRVGLTASTTATYDSNIFATNEATHDLLVVARARASYERQSRYSLHGAIDWSHGWFSDNASQNFSDPTFEAGLKTSLGDHHAALDLVSTRTHSANSLLGTRVDRRTNTARFMLSGPLSGIYRFAGELDYASQRYATAGLQNLESWSTRWDVSRQLTPKLSGFAGLGFNLDDPAGGSRSRDWSWSAGLSKQLLPKVTGTLRAGWQTRRNDAEGVDFGGFTTTADLSWRASPRWRLGLLANRGVSTIASGQSVESEDWNLTASVSLPAQWSASASAGQTRTHFLDEIGRRDRLDSFSASLSHPINNNLSASLTAQWSRNQSSSRAEADYRRSMTTLSLTYSL